MKRIILLLCLLVVAIAAPFIIPGKTLLLTEIIITALFALSLDLILGLAGIVSLGHAAFFGVGAYAAGLFALHFNADPVLGLIFAMLISACAGLLSSFLILRGNDLTRLMTTIGVAMMLYEAGIRASWLTGGADGLSGFFSDPVLGLFEFDFAGQVGYFYALAVLFLAMLVVRQIMGSPFGVSLMAISQNPVRAGMLGIAAGRRIIAIYTLAAALAGAAGALLAQTTSFVSPDVLAFHRSADVLLMLVIGGTGWLYGGLVGAVLFILLRDWLSVLTPQYWMFWIGLLLVILVLTGRERLSMLLPRALR